ncbi:MAG: ATP synthase F0 subunit C [Elusimicrobia bacterium CG08_land_8_20_14_0_20_59_10]|nr:MAG: ATP synthase F0 subunit C [Elusimicrobia bacterium CG08_land_8_20_14_0_20_59_10]
MTDLTFIGLGYIAAGVGAGLTLLGAGLGIGKLAASALEGTARQPEAGAALRTTMIIAAALIEGLAFFALVICLLAVMNFSMPKGPGAGADAAQTEAHK